MLDCRRACTSPWTRLRNGSRRLGRTLRFFRDLFTRKKVHILSVCFVCWCFFLKYRFWWLPETPKNRGLPPPPKKRPLRDLFTRRTVDIFCFFLRVPRDPRLWPTCSTHLSEQLGFFALILLIHALFHGAEALLITMPCAMLVVFVCYVCFLVWIF